MKKAFTLVLLISAPFFFLKAQNLPYFMHFSPDHKRLINGNVASTNVFNDSELQKFELIFSQPNYWTLLTNNYQSKTDIPATLIINGKQYDSVGVRFKGQTSYQRVTGQKKSFNITMNAFKSKQDHQGYETFNLNNTFEDPSAIREITYLSFSKSHIPAARGAFAQLYINGEFWGPYALVQGLDSEFIQEWFLSNDGVRWRAERTTTGGGPGGGGFGAGTSSLNFLGLDTNTYKPNYTLKKSGVSDPWYKLMVTTQALNSPSLDQMYDTLHKVMDVDRALWFIATEILFGDDDSYINKGGMDYYVYWDKETGRLTPIEYDGNSCMGTMTTTWSPFLKESDTRFPLASRLLKVPELRQRYIAHAKVLLKEYFDQVSFEDRINKFYTLVDSSVRVDTKRASLAYTYAQFVSAKATLLSYRANRVNTYLNNTEFKQNGPSISEVNYFVEGVAEKSPKENQSVLVKAKISSADGVKMARLYYGIGFDGAFERLLMNDKGENGDETANDGLFSAQIPAFMGGTHVRFYIEAMSNNTASTSSFMPEGAEHDVYIYQVAPNSSGNSDIVINEIMASNSTTVADQDGEYDDWIELYNKSNQEVNISGWYLTDNIDNLDKYRIPDGTIMPPLSYLIVWADEDGKQAGYHANFKLSAAGENLYLLDSFLHTVDELIFPAQTTDMGYARVPNGTGPFIIQPPTYNISNTISQVEDPTQNWIRVYPNPVQDELNIENLNSSAENYTLLDCYGRVLVQGQLVDKASLSMSAYNSGVYLLKIKDQINKIIKN